MIINYEKFRIHDEHHENDFFMEVNWEKTNKKINDCKVVRFTFSNGDIAYVKREYLLALIFAIGQSEDQIKLIPQKLSTVRWHETLWEIKATKNIEKGEKIRFVGKVSCDKVSEQEVIKR